MEEKIEEMCFAARKKIEEVKGYVFAMRDHSVFKSVKWEDYK